MTREVSSRMSLDIIAGVLKVHPRTVLRAIAGEVNTYWAPGYDPDVALADVALAYGVEISRLDDVIRDRDEFLTVGGATRQISKIEGRDVPVRTFRYRKYPALIRTPGVVRYSTRDIGDHHVQHIA